MLYEPFILNGYSAQNIFFVINHLPPCRSKPIKALFIFGTQFNQNQNQNQLFRQVCANTRGICCGF